MEDANLPEAYQQWSAGVTNVADIECVPWGILVATVHVHHVIGSPTAASLACKWQIAPLHVTNAANTGPHSIGSEASSAMRAWQDVQAADANVGWLLQDPGDWPATLAGNVVAAPFSIVRAIRVPPLSSFVRIVLTAAFTGGTTPYFIGSVAYQHVVPGQT